MSHAGNASGSRLRRTPKPSCAGAGDMRWRAGWPDCSPPTRGSGRSCWSTGWTATPKTSMSICAGNLDLWRALVNRIDADPPHIRQQKTVARLREGPSDLPARLSLFGHTRLACTDIELLQALSTHHDLHLWLPHPSDDVMADARRRPRHRAPPRRHQLIVRSTTRCWQPSDATCANCNAACRQSCRPTNI